MARDADELLLQFVGLFSRLLLPVTKKRATFLVVSDQPGKEPVGAWPVLLQSPVDSGTLDLTVALLAPLARHAEIREDGDWDCEGQGQFADAIETESLMRFFRACSLFLMQIRCYSLDRSIRWSRGIAGQS